jgi:aldose 1-epimerase
LIPLRLNFDSPQEQPSGINCRHIFSFIALFGLLLVAGCNQMDKTTNHIEGVFSISERPMGTFEGIAVTEYTVSNPQGMRLSFMNYGGTVTKIIVPDRNSKPTDVVLGFDSLPGYLQKEDPYFGSLIGRYGNRIAKGRFQLNGQEYQLATNNNGNSLHGGLKGFDKVIWTVEKGAGDSSAILTYRSKDGEEGYPGNLDVKVTYTLTANNEFRIEYSAVTDKDTPVNLTNHAYFNLSSGEADDILSHELRIDANKFTEVDSLLIPTGTLATVDNGPMDFRTPKLIGRDINAVAGGFDHNWVLNNYNGVLRNVATLYYPPNGIQMDVLTTEPGLQFYSGNFLDGTLQQTKNGRKYPLHGALCLEAQHYPDSPNQPDFPSTILKPGETYSQTTVYAFSVK